MRVCVTGGTGSLGSALIARLASRGADRIVTLSRDEHKRAALQAAYRWHPGVKVYAGDIRDRDRLVDIFAGCEYVVHAAARKVVCGHFDEPREHHLTNVVGTVNVLGAARAAGVRKVLFISSDKAVEPINVYGVSKALAEHQVVSENARCFADGMRCSVVRYGNVLGSNGSVIKVWRALRAEQKPLPVSDPCMSRFWWTIEEAAETVLRAIEQMRGGEILLPAMKAAPLGDLLEAVAPDAEITVTGIRQGGEKMHETLISEEEVRRARIYNGWAVIPPADSDELWDRTPWLGDPVEDTFTYRSDTWPERWSVEELRRILAEKPTIVREEVGGLA